MKKLLLYPITVQNTAFLKMKILKRLFFVIALLFNASSFAQVSFDWANLIGEQSMKGTMGIVGNTVDQVGNSYMVGKFRDTVDFDPSSSELILTTDPKNSYKYFILKMNKDGSFGWVKTFDIKTPPPLNPYGNEQDPFSITNVYSDKNNEIVITGNLNCTMDFDLGPSEALTTKLSDWTNNTSNGFIAKYSSEGEFKWVTTYQYPEREKMITLRDFDFDSNNNYYFTGTMTNFTNGNVGSYEGFNSRMNSSRPIDFGNGNKFDVLGLYVLKLDDLGNFMWLKSDSLKTYAGIEIDNQDNIILTGSFADTTDFDLDPTKQLIINNRGGDLKKVRDILGPYSYGEYQFSDVFFLKMDKDANVLWAKNLGGRFHDMRILSTAVDNQGNTYCTIANVTHPRITTYSPPYPVIDQPDLDIDPGPGILEITDSQYASTSFGTSFLVKYTAEGELEYAKKIIDSIVLVYGAPNTLNFITYVTLDKCDNIYIAAKHMHYENILPPVFDVDPDTTKVALLDAKKNIALIKYDNKGNYIWSGIVSGEVPTTTFAYPWTQSGTQTFGDKLGQYTDKFVYITDDYSIVTFGYPTVTNFDFNPDPIEIDSAYYPDSHLSAPAFSVSRLNQTPPPPLSLSASVNPICPGQESVITATGADTYTWTPTTGESSNAGATYTVKPSITTKYTVQGISNNCVLTDTITISTTAATPTNAGKDTAICEGSSVMLKATDYTTTNWSTGATTAEISVAPTETTSYVFSTVSNNCPITDTVVVTVNTLPIIGLSPFISIQKGSSTVLNASGGGSYLWTPADGLSCSDCPSPTATPEIETDYCVTVTNENNCVSKACEKVKFDVVCGDLFIPNGFSPNGDNLNDKLEVKINAECVTDFNFMIFDRWGEKVFETDKITVDWDGKVNGKELDNAVFVYYAKVKLIDSSEYIVKKGNVSIIK